jgi:pyridoxine 5-phosphate synthase
MRCPESVRKKLEETCRSDNEMVDSRSLITDIAAMTRLLINVDHVATLRNARGERFPDPVQAAAMCEAAGADGVVFHLREDRRHITEKDVHLLKQTTIGKLDFELSLAEDVVGICLDVKPHLATLVPERREELTTEGGLDVIRAKTRLSEVVPRLKEARIEVSTFIEPDLDQVDASVAVGADAVEFHTGAYANAHDGKGRAEMLDVLAEAAKHAHAVGLEVHAGHGLDYHNYTAFRAAVPHVSEVSIGFAIIARALIDGLETSVREMVKLVKG